MAPVLVPPKAFAVWFKDLERWDPSFFHRVRWAWPQFVLRPISEALRREAREVAAKENREHLPIIEKISFGGAVSLLDDPASRKKYKGRLFWANAGNLVYSKIRVKQGSLAVVPASIPRMAVSAEYPVYSVMTDIAHGSYLILALRSVAFQSYLDGLAHGGSTKTRIHPADFERLTIPIPPLPVQETIVVHWRKAQEAVTISRDTVAKLEAEFEETFFRALGIRPIRAVNRPKFLAMLWHDLPRWAVSTVIDHALGLHSEPKARFRYVSLGNVASVSYGIQKCPANRPGTHARPYLRVANVRKGYLDLSEIKTIDVPDSEMESLRLLPRDILFVEGNGSRAELGRVAMWNGEIPDCVHQNHLIKVRCDTTALLPEFAMTWFNTDVGRGHFFRSAKTSSGLGTINSSEVRTAPIPLPPLQTQREIVDIVNRQRQRIAEERKAAEERQSQATREVEDMILGIRPVG